MYYVQQASYHGNLLDGVGPSDMIDIASWCQRIFTNKLQKMSPHSPSKFCVEHMLKKYCSIPTRVNHRIAESFKNDFHAKSSFFKQTYVIVLIHQSLDTHTFTYMFRVHEAQKHFAKTRNQPRIVESFFVLLVLKQRKTTLRNVRQQYFAPMICLNFKHNCKLNSKGFISCLICKQNAYTILVLFLTKERK